MNCGATKEMSETWVCDQVAGHENPRHEDSTKKAWWLPGAYGTYEPHHIAIEEKDRPKFDWYGSGFRWICSCGKKGDGWWSNPEHANRSGAQHSVMSLTTEQWNREGKH